MRMGVFVFPIVNSPSHDEVDRVIGMPITTVAIITHNAAIAPLARRVIRVRNGQIESVEMNDHPASVEEIAW